MFGDRGPRLGHPSIDALVYVLIAVATSLGLALCSWHLFERPILRLKALFPYAAQGRADRADQATSPYVPLPVMSASQVSATAIVEGGAREIAAEVTT